MTKDEAKKLVDDFTTDFEIPDVNKGEKESNPFNMSEFDAWLLNRGYYEGINLNSAEERNTKRNQLRSKLNYWGSHADRFDMGLPCFTVEVYSHQSKVSEPKYVIIPLVRAIASTGLDMTQRVQSLAQQKRKLLERFKKNSDWARIPMRVQVRTEVALDRIDEWEARTMLEMEQMAVGFERLRQMIDSSLEDDDPKLESNDNSQLQFFDEPKKVWG